MKFCYGNRSRCDVCKSHVISRLDAICPNAKMRSSNRGVSVLYRKMNLMRLTKLRISSSFIFSHFMRIFNHKKHTRIYLYFLDVQQ